MKTKGSSFLQLLGPGLLFASTAIGVSHLVQSTRAGADYGFGLLWAVLLANLLKWPFFEYGSRYASATGKSLIDGYHSIGKWLLWLYLGVTLTSMFFVGAAVGAVTAAFMDNLFHVSHWLGDNSIKYTTTLLFLTCVAILILGKYKTLSSLIKVVGLVLFVSTLGAVVIAIYKGPVSSQPFSWLNFDVLNTQNTGFLFLIALMGWMPTAVDLSTWNSLWTIEREKQLGWKPSVKQTLKEFNLGYWISGFLAPCFMLLGAYMLYGTEQSMPEESAAFASSIVSLYSKNMGAWSQPIISAATFSIMFGTCIGVFDGYSRSLERVFQLLRPKVENTKLEGNSYYYNSTLLLLGLGGLFVIFQFGHALKSLVDFATILSFLIAPIIALFNFKLVTAKNFPAKAKPNQVMRVLSYLGISFLLCFALAYLYSLL